MQHEIPPTSPRSSEPTDAITARRRAAAALLAELLAQHQLRLVLAESCTGGQVASSLTEIPGISQWWCGSWVTYRDQSKQEWLGIPAELIERHTAVSPEVTVAMAGRALERTLEASLAGTITGHLGPHAPQGQDGQVFTAVQMRGGTVELQAHQLPAAPRVERLELATLSLLTHLKHSLEQHGAHR